MLIARQPEGGQKELVPSGTYAARCFAVVDIGSHLNEKWHKTTHKVILGFELATERKNNGDPFFVWKTYTLSLHEKAQLRAHLESWRGKPFAEAELQGFDLAALLSKPCLITVVHSEDGKYANLSSISGVPKGMEVAPLEGKPLFHDMDATNAGETYEHLPEWIQDKIDQSVESNPPAQEGVPF